MPVIVHSFSFSQHLNGFSRVLRQRHEHASRARRDLTEVNPETDLLARTNESDTAVLTLRDADVPYMLWRIDVLSVNLVGGGACLLRLASLLRVSAPGEKPIRLFDPRP